MRLIAHRGLLDGPDLERENLLSTVDNAIEQGFEAEVDLWVVDETLYLGHDIDRLTRTDLNAMRERSKVLWIHAKNAEALNFLRSYGEEFHYFWHEKDAYTLTSQGIPWIYPGKKIIETGVVVMPEHIMSVDEINKISAFGICSDFVGAVSLT